MNPRALSAAVALSAIAVGAIFFYGGRQRPAPRPDPAFYHTPEGINAALQEQRTVLADALQKRDLQFIHGQMYYLQGVADSLSEKLEGERKQRVEARLNDLKAIAEEIDNFSGRGNFEATQTGLTKLFVTLDALNAEFQPVKK